MTASAPPPEGGAQDAGRAPEVELGIPLVTRLFGLLRASRLYSNTNELYRRQLAELLALLRAFPDDEVSLVGLGDALYVNGVRLKARVSHLALFHALLGELESRSIGALRFLPGVTDSELATFVRLFVEASTREQGERLPEKVQEAGLSRIVPVRASELQALEVPPDEGDDGDDRGERARARRAFWHAVSGTRGLMTRTARTRRPAVRQARRLVQPIVDSLMKNEYSILGLTAIKQHDEYTYAHCVNVSILSIRMGLALGLTRAEVASLGVAALLHDVGKLAVPAEILNKPGALSPEEWAAVRRHPLEGVKMIARMPGLSQLTLDALQVSLQHHMNMDGSGYPAAPGRPAPTTISRIVSVADVFDAITAHRAYRRRAYTSHEALRHMLGTDRALFDDAVLWSLIQSVGVYPAGTVMRTASGHLVLSLSPSATDPWRPVCHVLQRPGDPGPSPVPLETWEPMPPTESVVHVLPPEEHRLDANELLAA